MPTDTNHIQAAIHDIATVRYLIDGREYSDWAATVAFYAGLHIVDAILFCDPQSQRKHGGTHSDRTDCLRGARRYDHIYRQYAPLWRASKIARYLQNAGSDSTILFKQYMTVEQVEEKLVRFHLWQLIKSAANFLPDEHTKRLTDAFAGHFPLQDRGEEDTQANVSS